MRERFPLAALLLAMSHLFACRQAPEPPAQPDRTLSQEIGDLRLSLTARIDEIDDAIYRFDDLKEEQQEQLYSRDDFGQPYDQLAKPTRIGVANLARQQRNIDLLRSMREETVVRIATADALLLTAKTVSLEQEVELAVEDQAELDRIRATLEVTVDEMTSSVVVDAEDVATYYAGFAAESAASPQTAEAGSRPAYAEETLSRFAELKASEDWEALPENAEGTREILHRKTGLVFALVPGGTYRRGSPRGDPDELPVRRVRLAPFLLARTECTQRAWLAGAGEDGFAFPGEDRPAECVTWAAARAWCHANGLRLPTEAEWEYACRAGTTTRYSWGDRWHPSMCLAENDVGSGEDDGVEFFEGLPVDGTAPVGSFPANAWGLVDMHGNVAEWCEDAYAGSYRNAPTDGRAFLQGEHGGRILRGGAWHNASGNCRAAKRQWAFPGNSGRAIGFRPASSLR